MAWKPETMRLPLADNPAGQRVILTTLALLAIGVVTVNSAVASVTQTGAWYERVEFRHTVFAVVAALVLLIGWRLDVGWLARGRWPVAAGIFLAVAIISAALVYIPGIGRSVGGNQRWIRLGPRQYGIGFQPSELIKLALPIFLAAWLSRDGVKVRSFTRTFLPAIVLIGVAMSLVITENFSAAVVIATGAAAAMLLAGIPWIYLFSLLPPAAGAFYVLVLCTPHRLARITAFLAPTVQDNPSTYQVRQSLLAITTGGWWGKGLGHGMIKQGFLPEDSTDFIFSVFCEEWGVVGAVLVIGLIIAWVWSARRAALEAGDRFGHLLAGALGFVIGMQAIMHVAVDIGALPPTGFALPFVSAGGTGLVTMAAATAMIVSVSARRQVAVLREG